VVIGGGLAGLIAAARIGRSGWPVVLLEKASAFGGRAATHERDGFLFNLGPHALYRAGVLSQTLEDLGIVVHGRVPATNGGYAMYRDRLHTLPVGLTSLLSTGLLSLSGKLEFARVQASLLRVDANAVQDMTLASWLDTHVHDEGVRAAMRMLVRVTSFTNDPERQSAGAALEQLQLGVRGNVLYLDGGWQTIVDGLRRVVIEAGARIVSGAHVVALERRDRGEIDGVRLADGRTVRAAAVIITGAPAEVAALTATPSMNDGLEPVRVATLDVALRSLPKPKHTVAFGVDTPLYFSVHSMSARLAPDGGALIHVSKYLQPGDTSNGTEQELEALFDRLQPGWRGQLAFRQYLPNMIVTNAELTAARGGAAGRPASRVPGLDNVFAAGDWVGPRGQLSDASAASATDAASLAVAAAMRSATEAVAS
jgi:phytoene dehydrogenase-like protein